MAKKVVSLNIDSDVASLFESLVGKCGGSPEALFEFLVFNAAVIAFTSKELSDITGRDSWVINFCGGNL